MRVVIQFPPPQPESGTPQSFSGNRDEFLKIEASRTSREALNEIRDEKSPIEKLDKNGGEALNGNKHEFPSPGASGNGDGFFEIEGSKSFGEVSGVRFSQSEGCVEMLEQNGGEVTEASGNRDEFDKLEASRSSGEVQFSQSEDQIEKLEKNGGGDMEEKRVGVELLCVVKAVLKKIKRRVLVGDKVLVGSIDWNDRRGMIENVFERKSEVLDPPVANVDHLVVLFSLDQPKIEPFALTRFLVEAESTGIPFFLALNKSELVPEETLLEWKSRLSQWGYLPVFCSIESKRGLDTLQFMLREQTSVIVGPSGVGKSSLINALRGNNPSLGVQQDASCLDHILGSKWLDEQRVGEISMRSGRGKHTTRHVSLLPLTGGGYLADTPGFNQPSLIKVTKQSLAQHFPEIRKMLEDSELKKCSFSNCLHIGEPGCVVKGDWERYPYYLQLLDEIRIREEFQLRTVGTKREGDVRYKTGELGVVQAEPRLEMKKHRRQSRKKVNQSIMDDLDEYEVDDNDENLLDENPVIRAVREEQQ